MPFQDIQIGLKGNLLSKSALPLCMMPAKSFIPFTQGGTVLEEITSEVRPDLVYKGYGVRLS